MCLTTNYLGLPLRNPLVASASPASATLDNLRRLEDAGAGAIVLPSLFQEQIEADAITVAAQLGVEISPGESAEAFLARDPAAGGYLTEHYFDLVRRGAAAVDIPVIASLNGVTLAGWTRYAELIEAAGAAAIELNIHHVPTDLLETGRDVENRYIEIVACVCSAVGIPVSVKLTPNFTAIGHFASTLVEHGADGLVLFQRLMRPDIDLLSLRVLKHLELSDPAEAYLPLQWIALLAGRTSASIAACTGVSTPSQVIKLLLAGADVVMTTSALLRHDIGYMTTLTAGLRTWMDEHEFASIDDMRGTMSWQRYTDRDTFTRTNYLRPSGQFDL